MKILLATMIQTLQENPIIGMISTVVAFTLTFIEESTPIIQWVSAIVFLLIGVITAVLKIYELCDRIKKKKDVPDLS